MRRFVPIYSNLLYDVVNISYTANIAVLALSYLGLDQQVKVTSLKLRLEMICSNCHA